MNSIDIKHSALERAPHAHKIDIKHSALSISH